MNQPLSDDPLGSFADDLTTLSPVVAAPVASNSLILDEDLTQVSSGIVAPAIPQNRLPREVIFLQSPDDPNCDVAILRLDNTTLALFNECSRASQFSTLYKREPKKSSNALVFGESIHAAFELLLKTNYTCTPGDIYTAILNCYAKASLSTADYRTPELALMVVQRYLHKFNGYPLQPLRNDPTFVERYFEHRLGELEVNTHIPYLKRHISKVIVMWTGRIDLICDFGTYPMPWVLDHKTTSIGGETFYNDFALSQQTVGYAYVCKHELKIPVMGLLLNALVIRKPTAKGECNMDLDRKLFHYSDDMLAEWQLNTMNLCADYVAHLQRDYFPMETQWCMGKWGMCGYHKVCTMLRANREQMLASEEFQDVTWTPKKEGE
jgi:hypothetical protein